MCLATDVSAPCECVVVPLEPVTAEMRTLRHYGGGWGDVGSKVKQKTASVADKGTILQYNQAGSNNDDSTTTADKTKVMAGLPFHRTKRHGDVGSACAELIVRRGPLRGRATSMRLCACACAPMFGLCRACAPWVL